MVSLLTVFSALTLVLLGRGAPSRQQSLKPTEAHTEAKP